MINIVHFFELDLMEIIVCLETFTPMDSRSWNLVEILIEAVFSFSQLTINFPTY